MKLVSLTAAVVLACVPAFATAAEDPASVDAVVAAVKAANPDMRALCQKGADGIRKIVSEKVAELVPAGKIKGNPQAVGGEAGQKLGGECRGG